MHDGDYLGDLVAKIKAIRDDESIMCDEMRWDALIESEELRAAFIHVGGNY